MFQAPALDPGIRRLANLTSHLGHSFPRKPREDFQESAPAFSNQYQRKFAILTKGLKEVPIL